MSLCRMPQTKEETKEAEYVEYSPQVVPYDPSRCAHSMKDCTQCDQPPGHGPDGLYCLKHKEGRFK